MTLSYLLPVIFGLAAVYMLLPRPRVYPRLAGAAVAGVALLTGGRLLIQAEVADAGTVLFYAFAGVAVVAGGLLITQRNPVHAALSFVLVVLSTCGLFLLQAAPFLMAATMIIYAGAIVVTFLFVIMLAQQEGLSDADLRSREPFLSSVAGFVLLGTVLYLVHLTYDAPPESANARAPHAGALQPRDTTRTQMSSFSTPQSRENVAPLGLSLFTDYLLAVELGGALLLAATVGAIAIVSRRPEGLR